MAASESPIISSGMWGQGGWPTFTFFVKVGIHAAFAGTQSLRLTAAV